MDETSWTQVNIAFPGQDPRERERQAVEHIARTLPAAQTSGLITSWFFIRKGRWRVRYLPTEQATSRNECPLHPLLTQGVDWTGDIYEPEVHAFGGPASMDTAHELFQADSRHLLAFLSDTPSDRRERSLILCTAFMRAAGLEFGEQGDVWARIAKQRCALRGELPAPSTWASFTDDVRRLLLGKACPDETAIDQPGEVGSATACSPCRSPRCGSCEPSALWRPSSPKYTSPNCSSLLSGSLDDSETGPDLRP